MITARAKISCPHCLKDVGFDMSRSHYIRHREAEFRTREGQLRVREKNLRVREDEHTADVRLIKSCLHPDKHPADQSDRYTKAWQAFERLLASAAKPEPVDAFDDNIPF
jgi:hypothetical protein